MTRIGVCIITKWCDRKNRWIKVDGASTCWYQRNKSPLPAATGSIFIFLVNVIIPWTSLTWSISGWHPDVSWKPMRCVCLELWIVVWYQDKEMKRVEHVERVNSTGKIQRNSRVSAPILKFNGVVKNQKSFSSAAVCAIWLDLWGCQVLGTFLQLL